MKTLMQGQTPNHQIATQIIFMIMHRDHMIATDNYDDEPLDDYIENLLGCICKNTDPDQHEILEARLTEISKIAKSESFDWNQTAEYLQNHI